MTPWARAQVEGRPRLVFVLPLMLMLVLLAPRTVTGATLLDVLAARGFTDAATVSGAPEVDRPLFDNNGASAVRGTEFVAAYYFADEADGMGLGPLHVSLFDRGQSRWVNVPDAFDAAKRAGVEGAGGAVLSVQITPTLVRLETHLTPSAGFQLLLDHSLDIVGGFCGFGVHPLSDESMLFIGCMAHFADQHQEVLQFFDRAERRIATIVAADGSWPVEQEYRRALRNAFARLPEWEQREAIEHDRDGSSLFDVDIGPDPVKVREDERRIAMFVTYSSQYVENAFYRAGVPNETPKAESIVDCDRRSRTWHCEQHEIAAFAASQEISIGSSGPLSAQTRDRLLAAALHLRSRPNPEPPRK